MLNVTCCILLGFWRALDKTFEFVVQPTGQCMGKKNQPTLSNSRAEFRMSDWYICHFPRIVGVWFCFVFFRNATKF